MLKEIKNTRQHPGELRRRWFHSSEQDLYLWHDEKGEIVSFQLCYAKQKCERALSWKAGVGYSHLRVDDGESSAPFKSTPILLADGEFDSASVLTRFLSLSGELPPDVMEFVSAHIREYPPAKLTA